MYWCRDGYTLVGSHSRVCLSNGTWAGPEPKCGKLIVAYVEFNHQAVPTRERERERERDLTMLCI